MRSYKVRFIGRQAADMNREPMLGYGHMSMRAGVVLRDRMIAIEPLPPEVAGR